MNIPCGNPGHSALRGHGHRRLSVSVLAPGNDSTHRDGARGQIDGDLPHEHAGANAAEVEADGGCLGVVTEHVEGRVSISEVGRGEGHGERRLSAHGNGAKSRGGVHDEVQGVRACDSRAGEVERNGAHIFDRERLPRTRHANRLATEIDDARSHQRHSVIPATCDRESIAKSGNRHRVEAKVGIPPGYY